MNVVIVVVVVVLLLGVLIQFLSLYFSFLLALVQVIGMHLHLIYLLYKEMTLFRWMCLQRGMLSPFLSPMFEVLQGHSHRRVDKHDGGYHNSLLRWWQVHVRMFDMLPVKYTHSFLTRSGVQKVDIGFSKLPLGLCRPVQHVELLLVLERLSCESNSLLKRDRLQHSYN
jgi:hypothetical protein